MDEVDWQRDKHPHNLLDDTVWEENKGAVVKGKQQGILSSTPCETFTSAREGEHDEPPGAPRPLRSKAEPYGLSNLLPRERKKAELGTILADRAAELIVTISKFGPWVEENPTPKVVNGVEMVNLWDLDSL